MSFRLLFLCLFKNKARKFGFSNFMAYIVEQSNTNNIKNKKIMNLPTTTTLPIELHVLEIGSSFNVEGNFDAAIMMEDEKANISEIIYIELHQLKSFLENVCFFEFPEETEEENYFMAYLFEGSEKGKEGIEFVASDYELMQFLKDFIKSDYIKNSKTVKQ